MSTFKNSRPTHLKILRPTSLRPAAEPLSRSARELLKEARTLTHSTAAASGGLQNCPSFLVREVSEVAESQGFQVLEIVRAIGRADITPGDCVKAQKLKMAKALCSYASDNPGVCESFFTVLATEKGGTTPFSAVLEVIRDTESDALSAAMVEVLVAVVLQVGLGLDNLRKMLSMLVDDGQLPRFAHLLLKGMALMAAEQPAPSEVPSPLPQQACPSPSPSSRPPARRRVAQFFVFDGVRSGLCLGREEAWSWATGYGFETWLWREDAEEAEAAHVLRLVGDGGKAGQPPRFSVDLLLYQGHLHLHTLHSSARTSVRCPLPVPARRWVHVVLSHSRNGLLRRAEADVWLDGQHAAQAVPYPPLKEIGPVSVLVGCGDFDPRSPSVPFRPGKEEQPVQVRAFSGLMDRVRLFSHPLTHADAAALAQGDAAAGAVTRSTWSCAQPGGVLPLAQSEGEEETPTRQKQLLKRTNAHREVGPESMAGRKGPAMLGSLHVGGRMGFCEALECAGQADTLVVLLAAALSLPARSQLEESPSSACPSPLPSPGHASRSPASRRRGSGGGQAAGRVAASTLQLLATVMKKGAGAGASLQCGSLGVGRVLGAVWFVLHKASSEAMTGDVLVGVLALVEACLSVERTCQQHADQAVRGSKGGKREVVGRVAASWLLGREVWIGRAVEVQGLVVKELRNMCAREPELMHEVWGLTGMLDVLRDMLWAEPRSCDASLLELARQREKGGLGLADGDKEWLREAVAEAIKHMCGANSSAGEFGSEEWQAVCHFVAGGHEQTLLDVVLELAAEEQGKGLIKAVRAEEWAGVILGVLSSTREAKTWCTGLRLLARRLAGASRGEVKAFVESGGWSAVAERLDALELTEEEEGEVYAVIVELLLATPRTAAESAPSTHGRRNSLPGTLSSSSLVSQEGLAVAQYIDGEDGAVVSRHMLELLLSFLAPRSALLRQRGINDLVLLLGRTPNNAVAIIQVPRWAETLVALVGCRPLAAPVSHVLPPSMVTWLPQPSSARLQRWAQTPSEEGTAGEEDMVALLGLWKKLVAKLIPAIVLKKDGWQQLQQLLSALARSRLSGRHRELVSVEGIMSAACAELAAVLDGVERWDGSTGAGASMSVVRDNIGGLLSCVLAEALRERSASWSREMLWEEWESDGRADADEDKRRTVLRGDLLQLVDTCFGKAASPGPAQVTLSAFCSDSGKKARGEVGPWLWPHAVWSLTMANMVGSGCESEMLRWDCERLLRTLLHAQDSDMVGDARARTAVEVLHAWTLEIAPPGEKASPLGEGGQGGASEPRKRRMSAELWLGGIVGGKGLEAETTLQGKPVEVLAGTGRFLAGKVKSLPDLGQGWRGRGRGAVEMFTSEALCAALEVVKDREEARAAVRTFERELGSAVRSLERDEEHDSREQREHHRERARQAESKARDAAEAAVNAEAARVEAGACKMRGRVAYGRRCWKQVLKAQVHERTVWGSAPGMDYALVGESLAALVGGWWKQCGVQGGDRRRRRLKRNAQGTTHAESAYDQSGTAPLNVPSESQEQDGGVTPVLEQARSSSVLVHGVKAKDRPDRHLGTDTSGDEVARGEDEAGSTRWEGNEEQATSFGQRTVSRGDSARTLDTVSSGDGGGDDTGSKGGVQASDMGDRWMKDGTTKGVGAEEMLDWSEQGAQRRGKEFGEWECELVAAGGVVQGRLWLTEDVVRFEPVGQREDWQNNEPEVVERMLREDRRWRVDDITEVHGRRYMLEWTALELFMASGRSVFFNLPGDPARSHGAPVAVLYRRLVSLRGEQLQVHYLTNAARALGRYRLTDDWVNRRISNLEYLLHLNFFAGRTYNDLTQYPVMPWVLADYVSESIDLDDPAVYRDLSKPIAAQLPRRVEEIRERYEGWCDPEIPAFHYGSHYSTAGWVLWYLLRLEPYSSSAIHMQGGRFDCPDRLFYSMADAYQGVTTSTNDVKELIPEFFFLPDFLRNDNRLDLGTPQLRPRVDHVELPPWAEGDAAKFVRIHRQALESEAVSASLHAWIDLIFGCRQQGPAAVEALNVFFYLTYEHCVDLAAIDDPVLRRATEAQIANFGQTPCQLFTQPHPRRKPCTEVVRAAFDLALYNRRPDGSVFPPHFALSEATPPVSPLPPHRSPPPSTPSAKPPSPTPRLVPPAMGDRCRSLPVTPQQRPWDALRTQSSRGHSSSEFFRGAPLDRMAGPAGRLLGSLVVQGVAPHARGGVGAVCFLSATSERLTAVTERGVLLCWQLTAKPSDGLPLTVSPLEPQPSQAGGTPRGLARGVLGGAATLLLGQSGGGAGEVRMGMLEVGQGRQQGFVVLERGASRVLLTAGHAGGVVQCYGVDGHGGSSLLQEAATHQEVVTCLCLAGGWACARGGMLLVTGSRDCTVRVWSLGRGPAVRGLGGGLAGRGRGLRDWPGQVIPKTPQAILQGHRASVLCVAADSELDVVVSGGADGVCLLHSLSKGRYIRALPHPQGRPVATVQLTRDGEVLMVGEGDARVHAVDINGCGARSCDDEEERAAVLAMALTRDHSLLLTAHAGGEVVARSVDTLAVCCSFPPLPPDCGEARVLEVSKCGNIVLVGTDQGRVAAYTSDTAMHNNISFVLQQLGLVSGS